MSTNSRPYAPNQTLLLPKQSLTGIFAMARATGVLARELTAAFHPTGAQVVDLLRPPATFPRPVREVILDADLRSASDILRAHELRNIHLTCMG